MVYEALLVGTVAIHGWIAADLLLARAWRRRFLAIALAAIAALLWSAGELLLQHAEGPGERHAARAILFLGVCALGPCWLAGAAQATRPRRAGPLLVLAGVAALPELLFWSTWIWDPSGLFVAWRAPVPRHGPLFAWHAGWSWLTIVAGFGLLGHFVWRARAGRARALPLLALLGLAPLGVNVVYLLAGLEVDPTPVVLGPVALGLRLAVLESSLAPYHIAVARGALLAELGIGMVLADAQGRTVESNSAVARILDRRVEPDEALRAVELEAAGHPRRAIEVHRRPLAGWLGLTGTLMLLIDRTEAREAERRLEMATRHQALSFLVSGFAHEINNPLTYVTANLDLLRPLAEALVDPRLDGALPPELRGAARDAPRLLGDAAEGAERIARLVSRLRGLVRSDLRGPPGPAPVDLSAATRRALELAGLGRPPGLLRMVRSDAIPPVLAREEDVVQIVVHLLINAIHVGGDAPPIEVEVVGLERGGAVRVRDRGPGIPPQHLPHVFDPFFTTRAAEATGLGLTLSYELARAHGGRLEAVNHPEGGAVFTLWLPLAEGEMRIRGAAVAADPAGR